MSDFFETTAYQEAVARLEYTLERRHQVALLTGSLGSGKSTLIRNWASQLRRKGCVVACISTPSTFDQDFLWELANQLQCEVGLGASAAQLWFQIREQLNAYRLELRPVIIVVDHAEEIVAETADILVALARFHCGDSVLSTLILVIDSEAEKSFFPRLQRMAELRIELDPWDAEEIEAFAHRHGHHLDTDAIRALEQTSSGNPRILTQILDLSQMAQQSDGMGQLSSEIVHEIREELL